MDYQELAEEIDDAVKKLQQVDVSVRPSDDDLEAYKSLRESARSLLAVTNHVIDGD